MTSHLLPLVFCVRCVAGQWIIEAPPANPCQRVPYQIEVFPNEDAERTARPDCLESLARQGSVSD